MLRGKVLEDILTVLGRKCHHALDSAGQTAMHYAAKANAGAVVGGQQGNGCSLFKVGHGRLFALYQECLRQIKTDIVLNFVASRCALGSVSKCVVRSEECNCSLGCDLQVGSAACVDGVA